MASALKGLQKEVNFFQKGRYSGGCKQQPPQQTEQKKRTLHHDTSYCEYKTLIYMDMDVDLKQPEEQTYSFQTEQDHLPIKNLICMQSAASNSTSCFSAVIQNPETLC